MTRFFALTTSAVLVAGLAHAQDTKLAIVPAHSKAIQEYVVVEHIRPITVSIPLELGATVPDGVTLEAVPLGLVSKVPEIRNYEYFVAGDKVAFVEPYTRKIVNIVH